MFKTSQIHTCCLLPLVACLLTACQSPLPRSTETVRTAPIETKADQRETPLVVTPAEPEAQHSELLKYWLTTFVYDRKELRDTLEDLADEKTGQALVWRKALLLTHPNASYRELQIAEGLLKNLREETPENDTTKMQLLKAALKLNQSLQKQKSEIVLLQQRLKALMTDLTAQEAANRTLAEKIDALTSIEERMKIPENETENEANP